MLKIPSLNIGQYYQLKKTAKNNQNNALVSTDYKNIQTSRQNIPSSYNLAFLGGKLMPVYILEETSDGINYTYYKNAQEAASVLNVSTSDIYASIKGKPINDKYIAQRPEQVEVTYNSGEKEFSSLKANRALQNLHKDEVYMISKLDGSYQKFKNRKAAAQAYNVSTSAITTGLNAKAPLYLEAVPYRVTEIESEDKNGILRFDNNKYRTALNEVRILPPARHVNNGIYVVTKDKYERFDTRKDAAEILNIPIDSIYQVVNGYKQTYKGNIIFIKASEVEDKDGNLIDEDKLKEAAYTLQSLIEIKETKAIKTADTEKKVQEKENISPEEPEKNTHPKYIYLFNSNGEYKIYSDVKTAANELNIKGNSLYKALLGDCHTVKGFMAARPWDIEDEKGNIDKIKVNKFLQDYDRNSFYAVKRKDDKIWLKKFSQCHKEVSKILNVPNMYISLCLTGKIQKTPQGYYFINSNLIETEQEDGTLKLDKRKLLICLRELDMASEKN